LTGINGWVLPVRQKPRFSQQKQLSQAMTDPMAWDYIFITMLMELKNNSEGILFTLFIFS
jgi:hypothetical protein